MSEKEILARGCVHVNYVVSKNDNRQDLCLIKEKVLYSDGTMGSALRPVKNAKRSWYYTIPPKRDHQEKKEWEKKKYTQEYKVNQAQLVKQIAMVTGQRPMGLRRLNQDPYIYGSDIRIESCIRNDYDEKVLKYNAAVDGYNEENPDNPKPKLLLTPSTAFADFEWDIETKLTSIGAYVFEDRAVLNLREDLYPNKTPSREKITHLFYQVYLPWLNKTFYRPKNLKTWVKEKLGTEEEFHAKTDEEIETILTTNKFDFASPRNYKLEVNFVKTALNVAADTFGNAHQDRPDYLAFWNGSMEGSDITTVKGVADYYNRDWSEFMCDPDPRIPKEFKVTEWVPGQAEKPDVNGNPKKIDLDQRWSVLRNLASWQYLDQMCLYSANRMHLPNKPTYGLDFILKIELGLGKFKFKGLDPKLDSLDVDKWHMAMAAEYPEEYAVYAIGDVIPMQILEDTLSDVSGQYFPKLGVSPIDNFKKNPRRNAERLHFSLLKKGYVIGSTSNKMTVDVDNNVYTADSWIVTLNSTLHHGLTVNCLNGLPHTPTLYIPKVGDGDITSSYPSTAIFLNTSKATTYGELFAIDGLAERDARRIGMNISSGKGCAYNVCTEVLKYPNFQDWSAMYDEKMGSK